MVAGLKPVIGVSGPDHGGAAAWLATAWGIRRGGGRAVRLRPAHPNPPQRLDGLVIGGGADVSPLLYGADGDAPPLAPTRRPWSERAALVLLQPMLYLLRRLFSTLKQPGPDPARDRLEYDLLDKARRESLPVLGICRGMQLLNVHRGGTLYRSLHEFYTETPQWRSVVPTKRVSVLRDSHLGRMLRHSRLRVNALHNQAIDGLGESLRAVAFEANGVIQAIEDDGRPYCIGVQWHPEYLPQRPEQRRLFRALVSAAAQRRDDEVRQAGPG